MKHHESRPEAKHGMRATEQPVHVHDGVKVRTIAPTTGCTNVTIRGNVGAEPPNEKASQ